MTIQVCRDRDLHPRYAALASHLVFTPKFCLPATPANGGGNVPRQEWASAEEKCRAEPSEPVDRDDGTVSIIPIPGGSEVDTNRDYWAEICPASWTLQIP